MGYTYKQGKGLNEQVCSYMECVQHGLHYYTTNAYNIRSISIENHTVLHT